MSFCEKCILLFSLLMGALLLLQKNPYITFLQIQFLIVVIFWLLIWQSGNWGTSPGGGQLWGGTKMVAIADTGLAATATQGTETTCYNSVFQISTSGYIISFSKWLAECHYRAIYHMEDPLWTAPKFLAFYPKPVATIFRLLNSFKI